MLWHVTSPEGTAPGGTTPPGRAPLGSGPALGLSSDESAALGLQAMLLLDNAHLWIHRRVESVEFIDETTFRRQVSVDFTVPPAGWIARLPRSTTVLLPLASLRKERLKRFDLVDEKHRSLPLLTSAQGDELFGRALRALAEQAIRKRGIRGVDPHFLEELAALPGKTAEEGVGWLNAMLRGCGPGPGARRRVLHEPGIYEWAAKFANEYVLVCPLNAQSGERRVLKYGTDQTRHEPRAFSLAGLRRRLSPLQWFSWVNRRVDFRRVTLAAESFHFEVAAPPDLEITDARFVGVALANRTARAVDAGALSRAHIHISGLTFRDRARVDVKLRAQRTGLLRTAPLIGALTAALLWLGLSRVGPITSSSRHPAGSLEGAAALLLVVPTLLSVYVARPGEHALATSMLLGVRLVLVAVGGCSLAAAGLLVGGYQGHQLHEFWRIAAWVATSLSLVLWLSWFLPRPGKA